MAACHAPPPPDTLRIGISQEPETLDPRFAASAGATRLAQLVCTPLVGIGDDLLPVPLLASTVTVLPDGGVRVVLPPTRHFSDGSPLTADDVAFTIDSARDPKSGSAFVDRLSAVAAAAVRDATTVDLVLRGPAPGLLVDLAGLGIVSRRCGGDRMTCSRVPVCAGAYRVAAPAGDGRLVLVATAEGGAHIPALSFTVIPDALGRALALMSGTIDLVSGDIAAADLPALRARPDLVVSQRPGLGFAYLALNVRPARDGASAAQATTARALADPRVRRALALALPVEQAITSTLQGAGRRTAGMMPEGHPAAIDTAPLPYDPQQAEALLDAAGFGRDLSGARFSLVLSASTDRARKATALAFAEAWRDVGVDARVDVREWSVLYPEIQRGQVQAFVAKWTPVLDDTLLRFVLHTSNIPAEGKAGGNRSGLTDPPLDALLDRALATADASARHALFREANTRASALLPFLPLWFEDEVTVHSAALVDYRPRRTGSLLPLVDARLVRP